MGDAERPPVLSVQGQLSLLGSFPTEAQQLFMDIHGTSPFIPTALGAMEEGCPHPVSRGRSEAGPAQQLKNWPAAVLGCHPGTPFLVRSPF